MKKLVSILMTIMLVATLFTGCGSKSEKASDSSSTGTTTAPTTAPTEAAAKTVDVKSLKIGAITTFVKEDGGWCQAQYNGIVKAMSDLGIPSENLTFVENTAEETTAVTAAVDALVSSGVSVIMGASTGYAPIFSELASQYPEVTFIQVGDKVDNVICYQIRDYQAMFLLGYTSALMSDNDLLGYSAGMSEASVRRGINAFALGAKYAEPKDKVQLVWANSWYDVDLETQCAKSLIDMGIKYMGINASSPAIPQTCEKYNAFCTGYHMDMHDYAPKAVMVSFVWNWAPILEKVLNTIADGTATKDDYYFWGAEKDAAQISAFNDDIVPKDVQDKVLDVQKKIISGEIDVYAGELKDNEGNVLVKAGETMSDEDISAQKFLVDNVIGTWK